MDLLVIGASGHGQCCLDIALNMVNKSDYAW